MCKRFSILEWRIRSQLVPSKVDGICISLRLAFVAFNFTQPGTTENIQENKIPLVYLWHEINITILHYFHTYIDTCAALLPNRCTLKEARLIPSNTLITHGIRRWVNMSIGQCKRLYYVRANENGLAPKKSNCMSYRFV